MKTNNVIMSEVKYANGKEAYSGSVLSTYGSTLEIIASAQINVSNAGKIVTPAEDKLNAVRKKLKRGQIGARKQVEVQVGGTQILKDVVAEVNDLDTAAEVSDLPSNGELVDALDKVITYQEGENQYSLKEVLEIRKQVNESNRLVRERIEGLKQRYGYTKGSKMNDDLLEAIAIEMKDYTSITGVDMVINLKCKHVINLKGNYVTCQDVNSLETMIETADYPQQGDRLVAGRGIQQLIIPIQTVEQIDQIKGFFNNLIEKRLQSLETADVYTEDNNPKGIDFAVLKVHDSKVKGW